MNLKDIRRCRQFNMETGKFEIAVVFEFKGQEGHPGHTIRFDEGASAEYVAVTLWEFGNALDAYAKVGAQPIRKE